MYRVFWLPCIVVFCGVVALALGIGFATASVPGGAEDRTSMESLPTPIGNQIDASRMQISSIISHTFSQQENTSHIATQIPTTTSENEVTRRFQVCGIASDADVAKEIEAFVAAHQFKASLASDSQCAALSITLLGPAVVNPNTKINATTKLSVSTTAEANSPAKRIYVEINSRNGEVTVSINSAPLPGLSLPEGDLRHGLEQSLQNMLED